MNSGEHYLAFDLGAESGRAVLGTLDGDELRLSEIHRFANGPVCVGESLYWDPLYWWGEIIRGLKLATAACGGDLAGIGLDTWGVDFSLVDRAGELLGLPHHYRDPRTAGILEELEKRVSPFELYCETGSWGFTINTLCQLLALRRAGSPALDIAHRLLMTPDLLAGWLCGRAVTETTIAGSTGFYDVRARAWNRPLLARLGLPSALPGELVPTATVLGPLRGAVAAEAGLGAVPVIAPACHDTPCAFAAVPADGPAFTAISSGTWSVVGSELDEPVLTGEALARGFLNEVGACGKTLLALNSAGLWPLQECLRAWRRAGHPWGYAALTEMAAAAPSFGSILDPDAPEFNRPDPIEARIAAFCRRTGQATPADPAAVVRGLLEGLALRYRQAVAGLAGLIGRQSDAIHIVGGGSANALLCQLTADATGLPVLAGPVEATATGNVLLQALARGRFGSLGDVRAVVRRSARPAVYEPQPSPAWDDAYGAFMARR